ncbi:hypothetical protein [Leuconostoc citreum]|uniref:hypothetical protein n=1 Tax=Leuconostoc citreum TaxID=33964 RepID=UPI0032DE61B0
MAKETYYVAQEQLDLITELKKLAFPVYELTHSERFKEVGSEFDSPREKALLRCLGGDTSIEFKVKQQLYRLWRIDDINNKAYMKINIFGTPDWTLSAKEPFTAPLEEIKKWQTPAWEIEKAD